MGSLYIHSAVITTLAVISIITGEGLFDPTYNCQLLLSVDESQQRKLQGVDQSLQSVKNIFIPLGAAALYYYHPGLLYATAAFIVSLAVIIYSRYKPQNKLS